MIVQGDNGTRLKLHIQEKNAPVDLTGAEVSVKIKQGTREIYKTAQVTGLGECEVELTSDDVSVAGQYKTQASINYADSNKFKSDIQFFQVDEEL